MISLFISRLVILSLGTLYPAYASYKAVKNKNVKEYVKWMMYWIVFALFTCAETFADLFLSWFPFYYEIKIIFVLWLLSPATRGSSILYRRFVHPHFAKREQEIDAYIAQASEQGYYAVVTLGSKGLSYAANMVVQGQQKIVEHIKNYNDESYAAEKREKRETRARDASRQRAFYEYDEDFYDDIRDERLYIKQQLSERETVRRSNSARRGREQVEGEILSNRDKTTSKTDASSSSSGEKASQSKSVDAASVDSCE